MAKKIVAVNCSPRSGWNTDMLVKEAARGAEDNGCTVTYFDLYRQENFTGCVSCFGCKLPDHEGQCVCKDGLTPILEAAREADGLIIGSPIYFGDLTSGFRALYERLLFQNLTYRKESRTFNDRKIPVLLITTGNSPAAAFSPLGYLRTLRNYQRIMKLFVGPSKLLIFGETQQFDDYDKYGITSIDGKKRIERRKNVFPKEKEKAYSTGKNYFK